MTALIFAAGVAYSGVLWLLAVWVARRRQLVLGGFPRWAGPLCGGVALACAITLPFDTALLGAASLIGAIICAIVDTRTGFIFNVLSLSMAIVAGVVAISVGRLAGGVLAAALVGGGLGALYLVSGRRGIGLGDVKLGAAIALGDDVPTALISIGSAFIVGAAYAGILLGRGRATRTDTIRFGPFLASGAAVGLTASAMGWRWW
jgi:prepilin signal peptidase PulO-like enzyme (type II secretory pathway)